jgi:hypothetical protein
MAWCRNREDVPPQRVLLLLMISEARRSQITISLLIPARAVSDLTWAFIRRLGEAFRPLCWFSVKWRADVPS